MSRRVPGLTYPHNDLLFWWVEGGAVALLGLLVLGVSGFWLLLRRPGVRQLALLACLMPILLHTQLEYPLYQSPVHWLLVLILVTWPIAVHPANRRRCPHSPRPPRGRYPAR
ncbi:MAG: Wzy polymerase domain-containing protein [Enterobacteriaceae bacterium]